VTVAARRELPPGPRWPVSLQTLRYGLDPYGYFEAAHREFGDVFTVRVMGETWVILAHPEAVRELYRQGPDELDSGAANVALRPLMGTRSVLLLDGAEHLRRRKLVLPPFHGERMRAYEDVIREATRREIAAWPPGEPVPTLPRMLAITLQVILRAVFGVQERPQLERLGAMLRRLVTWTTDPRRAFVFGFLGPDRLMGLGAFRRQLGDVDREILGEIDRRAHRGRRSPRCAGTACRRPARTGRRGVHGGPAPSSASPLGRRSAAAPDDDGRRLEPASGRDARSVQPARAPTTGRLPERDGVAGRPLPRAAPTAGRMVAVRRRRPALRRRRVRPVRGQNRPGRADPRTGAATGAPAEPSDRPPRDRHRPCARRPRDRVVAQRRGADGPETFA
jgi:hypothetical protein